MLDKLLGNSTQVDNSSAQAELQRILVQGEVITGAYQVIRDMFVFTNRRMILLDKQGISGTKLQIISISYKSIRYFSVETAGTFDRDSELKIWIAEGVNPICKTFKKGDLIFQVQRELVEHTC